MRSNEVQTLPPDSPGENSPADSTRINTVSRHVGGHTPTFDCQRTAKTPDCFPKLLAQIATDRTLRTRLSLPVPPETNRTARTSRPIWSGYYPKDLANANSLEVFSAVSPPAPQDSPDIHRFCPPSTPRNGENRAVRYLRTVRDSSGIESSFHDSQASPILIQRSPDQLIVTPCGATRCRRQSRSFWWKTRPIWRNFWRITCAGRDMKPRSAATETRDFAGFSNPRRIWRSST